MAHTKRSALLGFLAGAVGGTVGTVALVLFQTASLKSTEALEKTTDLGYRYSREQRELQRMFEQAHMETADAVAGGAGTSLSFSQKQIAAPVTEFAFGILCAGIYGVAAEYVPAVTVGFGTAYGATLFTAASELVLPALGFVPPARERTAVHHLGGLSGNVVYGAVTEAVRRLLR